MSDYSEVVIEQIREFIEFQKSMAEAEKKAIMHNLPSPQVFIVEARYKTRTRIIERLERILEG
jgi:hypothetical protein